MDQARAINLAIIAGGVLIALVGALADVIGYGNGGFGYRQVILIVVGAVVAAVGAYRHLSATRR